RFPEFTGEWKKMKVSELLDFYSTNSLSWEQLDYNNGKIKNLHYGLIHKGVPTMVDAACDYLPYIKEESMPKSFTLFKEGDVAFADASEDTNDVAKAIEVVNCDNQQIVSGLHTIHGRDNSEQTVIGYKGYAFASDSFHKQIRRIAQGTKVFSISARNFDEVYIGIPSKEEQTKIAKLLIVIDERIATQNKIIEDLKKLKSAIIEKHYCKVEKQIACVGDLGEPFSVGNLAKDDLTETGIPCVIYGELFTTYGETISQIESHTYKTEGIILSKKGDLLFPSSTTVDAMSLIAPSVINMDGVILGGDMFGIHISPNFNAQYLSYYFNHIAKRQLAKFAKGSTIIHLHYADIEKAKLLLPSLEEQNRMAKCLVTLDDKIKKERTFFDLLNSQKAYLLCHMFI
ncbi:restriction endonuclease subunit S, partial [Bacteroides caecimuris]|uniref:restriction endonuclease subunit S n=1 Tax=Bacteroides caecimuris TaxID=1796613 RepID=UPI0026E2C7AE